MNFSVNYNVSGVIYPKIIIRDKFRRSWTSIRCKSCSSVLI